MSVTIHSVVYYAYGDEQFKFAADDPRDVAQLIYASGGPTADRGHCETEDEGWAK
jgi:hypothetical protein